MFWLESLYEIKCSVEELNFELFWNTFYVTNLRTALTFGEENMGRLVHWTIGTFEITHQ
jgi:hypothetical protein